MVDNLLMSEKGETREIRVALIFFHILTVDVINIHFNLFVLFVCVRHFIFNHPLVSKVTYGLCF